MLLIWGPLSSQGIEEHFSDFLHLRPEIEGEYLPGLFLSCLLYLFPSRPSADPLTFSWCWAALVGTLRAFGIAEKWKIKGRFPLLHSQPTPQGETQGETPAWCIHLHANDGQFLSGLGPCKETTIELCWKAVWLKIYLLIICSERKTTQVGLKFMEKAGEKNCQRPASKKILINPS